VDESEILTKYAHSYKFSENISFFPNQMPESKFIGLESLGALRHYATNEGKHRGKPWSFFH